MLRWLNDLVFRARTILTRRSTDRELNDELDFHLSMDVSALRANGLSASEADREARRRFGRLGAEAEQAREGWGTSLLNELIADARHGLRQMRRRPL